MSLNIERPFMDVRTSRGTVKDYQSASPPAGIQPPNDYRIMERMWKRDEVIATAIDTTVDMVTRNGWDFVAKTNDKALSKTEKNKIMKQFEELNFAEVLDNIIYQMITYGDSFLELRRPSGTTIAELHPLETTEMRIKYSIHGAIEGYSQIPRNYASVSWNKSGGNVPVQVDFSPEGVIHFRMKWMGSKIYSETPLEPVSRVWAAKQNSFNYLDQMFMNLHPELFIHLRGASKEQYEDAREIIWRARLNPGKPIITYGSEDSSTDTKEVTANFDNNKGLFSTLEYLREAVLMVTRVPPVWIGLVNKDGANKSNSEAQIFSFNTRVRKIQTKIENKLNMELLPALGFEHVEFNFNPITYKDEESTFKNAAVMHSMQVKPTAIVKYFKRNGITDITEEEFTTPEESMELQQKMMGDGNQTARNMTSPSRQPSDKLSVKSKLDQEGSSPDGTKKLKEQSMKMRSMTNFNEFPYLYGVKDNGLR